MQNQFYKAKLADAANKRKYRALLGSEETDGGPEERARGVLQRKEETRTAAEVGHCQSKEGRDVPRDDSNQTKILKDEYTGQGDAHSYKLSSVLQQNLKKTDT